MNTPDSKQAHGSEKNNGLEVNMLLLSLAHYLELKKDITVLARSKREAWLKEMAKSFSHQDKLTQPVITELTPLLKGLIDNTELTEDDVKKIINLIRLNIKK